MGILRDVESVCKTPPSPAAPEHRTCKHRNRASADVGAEFDQTRTCMEPTAWQRTKTANVAGCAVAVPEFKLGW